MGGFGVRDVASRQCIMTHCIGNRVKMVENCECNAKSAERQRILAPVDWLMHPYKKSFQTHAIYF